MIDTIRRVAAVPALSHRALAGTVTVSGFLWLLAQDAVHPLIVLGLELFLSF